MIEATASPHDGRVARLELRGVATGYETIRLATGHGAATPLEPRRYLPYISTISPHASPVYLPSQLVPLGMQALLPRLGLRIGLGLGLGFGLGLPRSR